MGASLGCLTSKGGTHASNLEYFNTLKGIPLLGNLSDHDISRICNTLQKKEFQRGEHLMKEGDTGDHFYIITKGQCKVTIGVDGDFENQKEVATLNANDYCGEQALIDACTRSATVTAIMHTICFEMDRRTFQATVGQKCTFVKRAAVCTNDDDAEEEKIDAHLFEKSKEKTAWMIECIKKNSLFDALEKEQVLACVEAMHRQPVAKGDKIIKQGDEGNYFYLCDKGIFDVIVADEQGKKKKVAQKRNGDCFGEIALLHSCPRTATVQASSEALVWVVSRKTYRHAIRDLYEQADTQYLQTLQKISIFSTMLTGELSLIADALVEREYPGGKKIVKVGDIGNKFYLIKSGSCKWYKENGESGNIKQYGYFGELALLNSKDSNTRQATVETNETCVLLELSRREFTDLLGPLEEIMHKKAEEVYENQVVKFKGEICSLNKLKTLATLGRGAFGFVTLVKDPSTTKTYALKAIKKLQILQTKQEKLILREKNIMQQLNHPRLVNLRNTYKDKTRLYFLLDVCLGGELFTLLKKKRYFNEPTARFYSACVILGFEYMHSRNIIYRDLKPENLVLEDNGYLKITDFGFAKFIKDKTYTLCGTPDYLSPEIVTGQGHGKGVDWWTLGVLIFEMLHGVTPFFSSDQTEMYRRIVRGKYRAPKYFSTEVKDLVKGLLQRKTTKRLGVIKGGVKNIKQHEWFQDFGWEKVINMTQPPPYKPRVRDQNDYSNFKNQPKDDKSGLKEVTLKIEKEF